MNAKAGLGPKNAQSSYIITYKCPRCKYTEGIQCGKID